jgi:hypothetical protein
MIWEMDTRGAIGLWSLWSKKEKGKITLSFASPEKEKIYIYIYDVITWKKISKLAEHNYLLDLDQTVRPCPIVSGNK